MRPAFVFVPDRCTGCEACRVACGIENGGGRDTAWRQVTTYNPERHPTLPTRHLSLACNHCATPACARGCPARAYRRDEATGAVLVDEERCIGCRYCSWVCPYDAPRYDEVHGVMTKCTFCVHRLSAGGEPACSAACPTGALAFGSADDGGPEPVFPGLGAFGLGPALVVIPPRREGPPPGLEEEDDPEPPSFPAQPRKVTLASEKGLLVFTLVFPALVGWFAGGLLRPERAPVALPFLLLAASAMALSTAHLGRPLRAWRALLSPGTSWLSREVLAAGAFVALALPPLSVPHADPLMGLPALAAGVGLVVSIDRLYRAVPRREGLPAHSAEAAPTALLLAGLVAGNVVLVLAMAAVKGGLLALRWRRGGLGMPPSVAGARLLLLAATATPGLPWPLASGLALGGEALDRGAFYAALEPSTPAWRMEADARHVLASSR